MAKSGHVCQSSFMAKKTRRKRSRGHRGWSARSPKAKELKLLSTNVQSASAIGGGRKRKPPRRVRAAHPSKGSLDRFGGIAGVVLLVFSVLSLYGVVWYYGFYTSDLISVSEAAARANQEGSSYLNGTFCTSATHGAGPPGVATSGTTSCNFRFRTVPELVGDLTTGLSVPLVFLFLRRIIPGRKLGALVTLVTPALLVITIWVMSTSWGVVLSLAPGLPPHVPVQANDRQHEVVYLLSLGTLIGIVVELMTKWTKKAG